MTLDQACVPDCSGKECGDNGCEGECLPGCSGEEVCNNGVCESSNETGSPADIDGNGEVNMDDYYWFVQDYIEYKNTETLNDRSDLNSDGKMSMADYAIFVEEYLKAKGL